MKFSAPFVTAVSVGITAVSAFPSMGSDVTAFKSLLATRSADLDAVVKAATSVDYSAFVKHSADVRKGGPLVKKPKRGSRKLTGLINPADFKFDPKAQHVDLTSDAHKFIPPGPTDIRGPCPGLNLLANHGYLDRSGVTNLFQGIDAIGKVFGVSPDLGLALNAYAVVFNGNPLDLTWSIGGPYHSKGLGALGELITGTPAGISAHNIYEGDASIVRRDYYQPGANNDNVHVHLPYFQDLLDLGGDSRDNVDVWDAEVMLKHKANRFHQSVATNPKFFVSPFGGLVVTTAAERFVAEFAANNTADAEGYNRIYLDEKNLLAFFGVKKNKKTGKLSYTPGQEHLIPGWTRRPLGAGFSLADIAITALTAAAIDPNLLAVGGNDGTHTNSFTGVNVGDLTGGLYNLADLLLNPQAFTCFIYQVGIESLIPTQLNLVYSVVGTVLTLVSDVLSAPFGSIARTGNNPCASGSTKTNIKEVYARYPGSVWSPSAKAPIQ